MIQRTKRPVAFGPARRRSSWWFGAYNGPFCPETTADASQAPDRPMLPAEGIATKPTRWQRPPSVAPPQRRPVPAIHDGRHRSWRRRPALHRAPGPPSTPALVISRLAEDQAVVKVIDIRLQVLRRHVVAHGAHPAGGDASRRRAGQFANAGGRPGRSCRCRHPTQRGEAAKRGLARRTWPGRRWGDLRGPGRTGQGGRLFSSRSSAKVSGCSTC